MKKVSAGILLYRKREDNFEVLLVHPGGPYWAKKDEGCWDIPKGEAEEGETDLLEVAKREFKEEIGFPVESDLTPLGFATRKDGKEIYIWTREGDIDISKIKSNTTFIEWPPRSGKKLEIPEIDRGEYFPLSVAKVKIYPHLLPILESFEKMHI